MAKVLIGEVFTLSHGLALAVFVVVAGMTGPGGSPLYWFWVLPLLALDGYVWGLAGSALGRTAFGAALLAALLLAFSWMLTGLVAVASGGGLILFSRLALMIVAVEISRRVFCGADLRRRVIVQAPPPEPAHPGPWRVLLWLAARQGGLEAVVVLGLALLAGLLLPLLHPLAWPLGVLLAGVACGCAVLGREQEEGSYRFLGNQRLPVGWLWAVKSLCWLVVALVGALLVLLGVGLFHGIRAAHHTGAFQTDELTRLLSRDVLPGLGTGAVVLLALTHGFAVGQLGALVLRRRLIALLLSAVVAASVAALWLPALLLGGLHWWQFLGPPLLLLAVVRLAGWWWASDRLTAWQPVALVLGGVLLAGLWMAGGLWYRVAEVHDPGAPFDLRAFEASLPRTEDNEAGPLIRQASEELVKHRERVAPLLAPPMQVRPGEAEGAPREVAAGMGYLLQAEEALEKGWPAKDEELGRWLDEMFKGTWADQLRQAAGLPLGLVMDPRSVRFTTQASHLEGVRQAATLFGARALQLQARGDHAGALDELLTLLGLARQLRHKTPLFHVLVARTLERTALDGLERWLEKVGPNQDLLRRALDGLTRHEQQLPALEDNLKGEYYLSRNVLDDVFGPGKSLQSQLYGLSRQVPWEREREQRLLGALYASLLHQVRQPYWEIRGAPLPGRGDSRWQWLHELGQGTQDQSWLWPLSRAVWWDVLGSALFGQLPQIQAADLCLVRGARLQVALALYGVEQGKSAARLADLVPRYLPAVPADPYCGETFRYRLSPGETIEVSIRPEVAETRKLPAGQGVVWSTGPDGKDDGGRRQGIADLPGAVTSWSGQGRDVLFLAPRWERR